MIVLSAGNELPVNAIGWMVALLSLILTVIWIRYFYR